MDLKSNTQVGSKVEQAPLVLGIELKDEADATTAQGDHACSFVVRLRYVLPEVVLEVDQSWLIVFQLGLLLELTLGLDKLTKHEVADDC